VPKASRTIRWAAGRSGFAIGRIMAIPASYRAAMRAGMLPLGEAVRQRYRKLCGSLAIRHAFC
jgi:hypothetical protein